MQDLTTGPVSRHLLKTTGVMLVTMIFQTLYFLVDLYWVGRLGTNAVAGVAIAGNLTFVVLALTQMLGVGTTAVVAHAAGRKDHAEALLVFNQSQVMALVTGALFLVAGMAGRWAYARAMSADAATAALAADYLTWFVPAMALQFAMVAMGSALRAIGNFKTGTVVGTVTVVINMICAPILIVGWCSGSPRGAAGAAIRDGGDGVGAAGDRELQARHGRRHGHCGHQHDLRPDPDLRLGHRLSAWGRGRRHFLADCDRRWQRLAGRVLSAAARLP